MMKKNYNLISIQIRYTRKENGEKERKFLFWKQMKKKGWKMYINGRRKAKWITRFFFFTLLYFTFDEGY